MNTRHATSGVMIDGPDTADRDDAVWVHHDDTGYTAHVHIAHVAAHVRPGDPVDRRAHDRVHTRYRADHTRSMLPATVERRATLRPGVDQSTLHITMRFAHDGTPLDHAIDVGRLDDAHIVPYTDVTAAADDTAHPARDALTAARDLAAALLHRRRQAGAIALYDLAKGYATDEEGQLVALAAHQRNTGYLIVAELMIAANVTVATWAAEHDVPILFRNHRIAAVAGDRRDLADELDAAHALGDPDHYHGLRTRMGIVQRPATYDPSVGGHFGLNLPAYTHCTSPLRRYADLVNQRVLLAAVADRPSPHPPAALTAVADHVNRVIADERAARAEHFKRTAHRRIDERLDRTPPAQLDDAELRRAIRVAATAGPPPADLAAEIARRLDADTLPVRDWYEILFTTPHDTWSGPRDLVAAVLAARPHVAATLLNVHAQTRLGGPVAPDTVEWTVRDVGTVHHPLFEARLALHIGGEPVTSPPRVHRSKKDAKNNAAVALVARLAGVADASHDVDPAQLPEPRPAAVAVVPPERNDSMALNEYAQNGIITPVTWRYDAEGPAHERTFTCHGQTTAADGTRTATGTGGSKAAARTAAAARLRTLIESELLHDPA